MVNQNKQTLASSGRHLTSETKHTHYEHHSGSLNFSKTNLGKHYAFELRYPPVFQIWVFVRNIQFYFHATCYNNFTGFPDHPCVTSKLQVSKWRSLGFSMISCHDAGAHFGARHAGDGVFHEGLQGRRGAPQDGKTPSRLGPISPEKVARWKGNPLISRKSRLVKYDNLARCWCKRSLYLYDEIFCLMSFVHIHRQSTFVSTFMFIESQNMKCI